MSEYTPETLSPVCRALFDYMHGLDYEGLHWDTAEALEALRPIRDLESQLASLRAERDNLADAVGVLKTENVRLERELASLRADLEDARQSGNPWNAAFRDGLAAFDQEKP